MRTFRRSGAKSWLSGHVNDERELWERIRNGDAGVFEAFYRETAPRLRGFLRQLTGDVSVAEDLTQETFAQMWMRPNGFEPERGSLRAYLYGIGRKRAQGWWRKKGTAMAAQMRETEPTDAERLPLIADALERLPEEQRALLWLREVEGQSYAELAAILEIPIGTVRSRLFAAREGLRRVWQSAPPTRKEAV